VAALEVHVTGREEEPQGQLWVPFAGPTFVNRWTLGPYMGDAIMRHPSFRLMPLPRIGSVSVMTSARHYASFVRRHVGLGQPYVAAGQSQGGIVAALHGLTDPHAERVVMLNSPLHGAWLSRLLLIFPSASELLDSSRMLTDLKAAILEQPERFTSIFCPKEQVMNSTSPYLPGIENILVGSAQQLEEFTSAHPEVEVAEKVVSEHAVTHTSAMRNRDFRGALWRVISREAELSGRTFT
jgi:pimeloyl-ACP methyl ester carboxylesterase